MVYFRLHLSYIFSGSLLGVTITVPDAG
jgi:hypothetical protein